MAKKQAVNPCIVKAKVARVDYDFSNAMYEITALDEHTIKYTLYVSEKDYPKGFTTGKNITIWRSADLRCMYMALGDNIARLMYSEQYQMNPATRKHFDDYKNKATMRLEMAKRLDEIQQQMAVINLINTKSNADANQAKRTLADFLKRQAEKIRRDLSKRR